MVIFIAQARVRADALDAVLAAAADMVARTPGEPGCIAYAAHQVLGEPRHLVFVERWQSREDIDVHMSAPHTQAFLGLVATAVEAPPVIEMFDVA